MDTNRKHLPVLWINILMWCSQMNSIRSTPPECNPQVDILIVVDTSESMVVNDPYGKPLHNWKRMKSFLTDVIRELPVGQQDHRIGLIQYSDAVEVEFLLDQMDSTSQVTDHIWNTMKHSGGNTNTAGALQWTQSYITSAKRPFSKATVLIFTDGVSRDSERTKVQAQSLKAAGVEVFTVSLDTGDVDGDELYHIATSSYHRIISPDGLDNSAWQHSLNQAVYGICDLRVPPRDPICGAVLDIALVIDNSGSITNGTTSKENYELLKQFVNSLLDTLHIAPDKTRVGAVRFSTNVQTEFYLDTYMNNKREMKRHINDMPFEGFDTNISGALERTRTDIFNGNRGDRSHIPNVVIVIADGQSNVNNAQTRPQARLLKSPGTTVFVVAVITKDFHKEELEYIASDPDSEHYFESPTITTLPILKCRLLQKVCKEEIFSQCV